jgi:2-desacetyl-2-hydroxyethyl bacteriochlorophyllide A dehydrogenase
MRAAVYEGNGQLVIRDVADPTPGPDELIVEVEACGVCGTDVQIIGEPPGHPSTPPVILGHEFVGRIVATGANGARESGGGRVVVDPDPKCGECDPCRTGRPANCERIVALGIHRAGALARYVAVPRTSAYSIEAGVPAQHAALVEPLACVLNGTNRAALRPGETVVIFGAGAIGCLFVAVFRAAGAGRIVVVEPSPPRGEVARSVGAEVVLTPDEWTSRRRELAPARAEVVVDAVGSLLPEAIDAAALGGRVILFGMNGNARPQVHQVEIVEKGLSILGSFISNYTFPAAIRMIEAGMVDLAPLITEVLPLADTRLAIDRLRSGQGVKFVVTP